MTDLTFSVVVPTFNRLEELVRCVDALAQSTIGRRHFEVVVVNDGGDSPEKALESGGQSLNLRVLTQQNRGPGAARNYGAASARGNVIAFTDDDCVVAPTWLEQLERSFNKHPDSLHGGRTVNSLPRNPFAETSQSLVDYVHAYYNDASAKRTRFFASNNIAVAAARFEASGGFDESLRAAEDRDFCRTWYELGWDFQYAPDAIVNHAHHLTLAGLQKQHFTYGRGALPYWRKAARKSGSNLKVEPLGFYTGMLAYPFKRKASNPLLLSALIVVSQLANAAGFAYEALRTSGEEEVSVKALAETPVPSRTY